MKRGRPLTAPRRLCSVALSEHYWGGDAKIQWIVFKGTIDGADFCAIAR
jgi:hypothetical protein